MSGFNGPATGATSDIEHALEGAGIGLFWKNAAHGCCEHVILDGDTLHFLYVLAILHKIGAGVFVLAWVLWIWHAIVAPSCHSVSEMLASICILLYGGNSACLNYMR